MPMPMELKHASREYEAFLASVREISDLTTDNQAYTMTQGVFLVFRRRLELKDAIRFANALPPLLRAIFIADWDVNEPPVPFADRTVMTREVQALRKHHNFSPDTCIRDVAEALRKQADWEMIDRVLISLSGEARDFWAV